MLASCKKSLAFMVVLYLALGVSANAQSGGSSTSVTGTVVDPTGAVDGFRLRQVHVPSCLHQFAMIRSGRRLRRPASGVGAGRYVST